MSDELDAIRKTDESKEIKRPLILFVHDVVTEMPPDIADAFKQPQRNLRLEMSKERALMLRDYLNARLEQNIPGTISVQLKGYLQI